MAKFTYDGYNYTKITKEEALKIQDDVLKDDNKVLLIVGSDVLDKPEAYVKGGEFVNGDLETTISMYEGYMDRVWGMEFDEIYIYLGVKC